MVKTVLIVDDEPDMRMIAAARLKKIGYLVLEAADGQEGIDIIRSHKPDLVLLDLALPILNGYEVCRQSKNGSETKDIPIILFTASVLTHSIAEKTKEFGANDYIIKPFEHSVLEEKIRRVLGEVD